MIKSISLQELKHKIIESLNQSENELLLAEIYEMLQTNWSLNESKHPLSEDEKKSLTRGLKDFEEGRVLSDEEVRTPYAKYLKRELHKSLSRPFMINSIESQNFL